MKQLKQLQRKRNKKVWGLNRIRTHDLCDTGAMLYQLPTTNNYQPLVLDDRPQPVTSQSAIYIYI